MPSSRKHTLPEAYVEMCISEHHQDQVTWTLSGRVNQHSDTAAVLPFLEGSFVNPWKPPNLSQGNRAHGRSCPKLGMWTPVGAEGQFSC